MPERKTVHRFQGQGTLTAREQNFDASYDIRLLREILDGSTFGGRDDTPGLYDTKASLRTVDPEAWFPTGTKAELQLKDGENLAITLAEGLRPNKPCPFRIDDVAPLIPGS